MHLDQLTSTIRSITSTYTSLLARIIEGEDLPPSIYKRLKTHTPAIAKAATLASLIGLVACTQTPYACILAAAPLALPLLLLLAGSLWRSLASNGIDQEIPLLLAYLLPYSHTPTHLTDLLVRLPRPPFKWSSREAERLDLLVKMGYDPLTALKKLAGTTPSKKLSRILNDYIAAHSLGAPRSQITLTLLNHALAAIRDSWKRYIEVGRIITEAIATATIAVAALTPVTILTGGGIQALAVIALLAPVAGALLLIAIRPGMGEPAPPHHITLAAHGAPLLAATLLYLDLATHAMAVLAVATVIVESWWRRASGSLERGARSIRMAAEAIKYRGDYEKHLKEAEDSAGPLIRVLASSMRVAGKLGVANAFQAIAQVLEEAASSLRQVKSTSLILSVISIAAVTIGAYTAILIEEAAMESGMSTGIEGLGGVLAALAPLAPLPATVMHRGRAPSQLPSLVSSLLVYHVMTGSLPL